MSETDNHQFEFPSAGIRVCFRGNDLFLTPKMRAEFEDKYVGRVSERTMQSMLVMAQNVAALCERAKQWGDFGASFNSWTSFLSDEELEERWKEVVHNSHIYMRRVRKQTGGCLTWVVEWGKKSHRVHGHFVSDRWMSVDQQWDAKDWRNSLMGRCNMTKVGAHGYMWKEMGKGLGRRGTGVKLQGCMGDFVGKCGMRDFVIDSPMAECRRLACAMSDVKHRGWTEEDNRLARGLFQSWLAGRMDLGEEYDRYREAMRGAGRQVEHGDSWEDEEGGDTDFDVASFQK